MGLGTWASGFSPKAPVAVTTEAASPVGGHPAEPGAGVVAHAVSEASRPTVTTRAGILRTEALSWAAAGGRDWRVAGDAEDSLVRRVDWPSGRRRAPSRGARRDGSSVAATALSAAERACRAVLRSFLSLADRSPSAPGVHSSTSSSE